MALFTSSTSGIICSVFFWFTTFFVIVNLRQCGDLDTHIKVSKIATACYFFLSREDVGTIRRSILNDTQRIQIPGFYSIVFNWSHALQICKASKFLANIKAAPLYKLYARIQQKDDVDVTLPKPNNDAQLQKLIDLTERNTEYFVGVNFSTTSARLPAAEKRPCSLTKGGKDKGCGYVTKNPGSGYHGLDFLPCDKPYTSDLAGAKEVMCEFAEPANCEKVEESFCKPAEGEQGCDLYKGIKLRKKADRLGIQCPKEGVHRVKSCGMETQLERQQCSRDCEWAEWVTGPCKPHEMVTWYREKKVEKMLMGKECRPEDGVKRAKCGGLNWRSNAYSLFISLILVLPKCDPWREATF